jgi:hypothetical protein
MAICSIKQRGGGACNYKARMCLMEEEGGMSREACYKSKMHAQQATFDDAT